MKPVRNLFPRKLFAAGALLLLAAALPAAEPADFPFYKDIVPSLDHPESISGFLMDAEMYQDLPDMNAFRVYSPDRASCPFTCAWAMSVEAAKPVRRSVAASIERFETQPDGAVRIVVSAGLADRTGGGSRIPDRTLRVTGLTIHTAAKDFDKKVRVYTSNSDRLIAEGAFLDYSSRVDLRNDYIAFPEPVGIQDFAIVIDNYTEVKDSPLSRVVQGDTNLVEQYRVREEPKITGVTLSCLGSASELGQVRVETPVAILSQERKGTSTAIKFSNGFAPLGELTVQSADAFFSRPFILYDDAGRVVRYGTVRRLDSDIFRTAESERIIEVEGRRSRTWTLVLENGDYGELKDIRLTASGPVHLVRFISQVPLFDPEIVRKSDGILYPAYRVYYGAPGLPAAENPFADMMQPPSGGSTETLAKSYRPDCTLAPRQENQAFRTPPGISPNWGIAYKILMAVAAAAVLVILIVSVKGIDKSPGQGPGLR